MGKAGKVCVGAPRVVSLCVSMETYIFEQGTFGKVSEKVELRKVKNDRFNVAVKVSRSRAF